MKKIMLLIAMFLIGVINTFSQSNSSTVTIFSQNGEKFWVVIDGEKKNSEAQTKVQIENLTAPNYKFRIIFQDSKIASLDQNIYTKDVDNNFHNSSYVIRKNDKNSKYVIRLNSDEEVISTTSNTTTTSTTTTSNLTPTDPKETVITTNNSQAVTNQNPSNTQTTQHAEGIPPRQTTTTSATPQNTQIGVGINVNENPDGVNMNINMGGLGMNVNANETNAASNTTTTTTTTYTTTTSSSGTQPPPRPQQTAQPSTQTVQQPAAYVLPGYSGPIGCPYPMSPTDFATAKSSISSKSFEDSKLTIAKQIFGSNCLLSSQVKEIMSLFSFEDSKLEFAKFAYGKTYDTGNYFKVNDAFTFESSIDELNTYISGNIK